MMKFSQKRFVRLLLILALGGLIPLGMVILPGFLTQDGNTAATKKMTTNAYIGKALLSGIRTASAAEASGELDPIADVLFGQPDFSTGTAPDKPTATNLNAPGDLFVFDLTGQLFMADTAHNRVLIWDSVDFYLDGDPANVVLGQPDFETTEVLGPPTDASMHAPKGITVGYDGLIYVSDTGNNRVLVFFPYNYMDDDYYPGESYPIFVDYQEADYVLGQPDFESNTALPTGPDTLHQPYGIVTDVNDNLVVADHGNNRVLIYEWNLGTGTIGPEANWVVGQEVGSGSNDPFTANAAPNPPTQRSLNGPTGVAAGPLGDEIYVADTGNNRILLFTDEPADNVADGLIGQPDYTSNSPNNGGLSGSSLSNPTGLKMDAGNRLFVADTGNNRVLVFDRVNGDATADAVFGQPDFVSNTANNGGISAGSLNTPVGIATDSLYMDVYIADAGNHRVLQYFQPLINPTPVIGELDPGSVRAGGEGFLLNIWGSGIISDTVIEINGAVRGTGSNFLGLTEVEIAASEVVTTGQLTVTLHNPTPGGGVSNPLFLTVYTPTVGDDLADNVLGQRGFTTNDGAFAPVQPDTLYDPAGAVVDPETGRLFVSDLGNARVLSWPSSQAQADGGAADLVIGKPDFTTYFYTETLGLNMGRPAGLALDSQGNLYVAEAQENAVLVYTKPFANGMDASLIIRNLSNPLALHLDSQDNLYVADSFNHRVLFFATPLSSGNTTPDRVFGQPDLAGTDPNAGGSISADTLNYPSGVTLDAADNLYVADSANNRVLVYLDPANGDATADLVFGQMGDFTTGTTNSGGVSAQSLAYPTGLAVDAAGALFVADSDNNRVLRFDDPLTSDTAADAVIGQNGSMRRGQPNQGRSTQQGRSSPSQNTLNSPIALGLAPDGTVYVVDNGNSRVLGFQGVQATKSGESIYLPSIYR